MKKGTIRQSSIDAFSKKLGAWGETLPAQEKDLLGTLIDRATTVNIDDLGAYKLTAKIPRDAQRVFKSLKKAKKSKKTKKLTLGDGLWLRSTTTVPDDPGDPPPKKRPLKKRPSKKDPVKKPAKKRPAKKRPAKKLPTR